LQANPLSLMIFLPSPGEERPAASRDKASKIGYRHWKKFDSWPLIFVFSGGLL